MRDIHITLKDIIYVLSLLLIMASKYGSAQDRLEALEKQIAPLEQVKIDVATIKESLNSVNARLTEIKADLRRRRD